ncbi:hypothetical protein JKF63_02792 [Porcisia hertigi]|uniref:Leucine-rich repeat protein (LRRP) n=1 Tax=Porcisia hertigi TaxID=2761500 RepID=A0A836IIL8_9TRYP|nr:hypothetical protein JKF63_02792 [Porcisia hertigi]
MFTDSMLDIIVGFSHPLSRALLAASPLARYAAERCGSSKTPCPRGFSVRWISTQVARKEENLCLAPAEEVTEVMVVSCHSAGRMDSVQAAMEVSMWWVDRCLSTAVRQAAGGTPALFCCMRFSQLAVDRLMLYSTEDSPVSERSSLTHMRMPQHFFALQFFRLPELRHVQLSPSVRRLIVEVDIRSCLRWSPSDANAFLSSLQSPLRAVHVENLSVSSTRVYKRFHSSLLVLHLFREATASRDPSRKEAAFTPEDEEYEEEEIGPMAPPGTATTALPTAATATTDSTAAGAARDQQTKRVRLSAVTAASPALEELRVTGSTRSALPRWVEKCTRLKRVSLSRCDYARLDSLCSAKGLTSFSLDGCRHLKEFDFLCGFPKLQSVALKNCESLRDLSWVTGLSGELRSLLLHSSSAFSLDPVTLPNASGVRLSGLKVVNLSMQHLVTLRPLMLCVAHTLSELTLFMCLDVNGFSDLPALTALQKVAITCNNHMQNFMWLAKSHGLLELRATQCTQLVSLTGLEAMVHLRILDVTGCSRIQTIAPLAKCVSLEKLDLAQCYKLTRVSVVRGFPRLHTVNVLGCLSLVEDFRWIEDCPRMLCLTVPSQNWLKPAENVIKTLGRPDFLLH